MAYGNNPGNPGGYYPPPPPGEAYGQPGGYPAPPYAHWGLRVGATLIDGLIVGIPAGILYGIGGAMAASSLQVNPETGEMTSSAGGGLGVLIYLLGFVVAIGLGLWLKYQEGTTGQTVGKKVVGIKTIREDTGQYLGFGMAFVRGLAHIVDGLPCYIGYLWPIWDAKKQTFADKIIGSIVVRA